LYLPKSGPLEAIHVQGDPKYLKNIAWLEACKQLHKIGALTDNLVPSIFVEEAEVEGFGEFSHLLFILPFIVTIRNLVILIIKKKPSIIDKSLVGKFFPPPKNCL
jgi:hypothetical protein